MYSAFQPKITSSIRPRSLEPSGQSNVRNLFPTVVTFYHYKSGLFFFCSGQDEIKDDSECSVTPMPDTGIFKKSRMNKVWRVAVTVPMVSSLLCSTFRTNSTACWRLWPFFSIILKFGCSATKPLKRSWDCSPFWGNMLRSLPLATRTWWR